MALSRREFLVASSVASASTTPPLFKKGITALNFPQAMPLSERFLSAKNAGFDGVEIPVGGELTLTSTPDDVKRVAESARKAGVTVVSLWVAAPLSQTPLNHADPAVRAKGVEAIQKCLEFARILNCGALLLVPGRLGTGARFQFGYEDTWNRVSAELRKVIADAQRARVILTPENVWNRFLVSPLEMRSFVDQFRSPWLGVHFDIGNVMQFGYPQDWILTLGQRIKRVHAKDYKLSTRAEQGRFVDLLEGDVDWKEVMAALKKVGYSGFISPEYSYDSNDAAQLRRLSEKLDRILAMA
jgi:hexulose-6-phosphate isomerase